MLDRYAGTPNSVNSLPLKSVLAFTQPRPRTTYHQTIAKVSSQVMATAIALALTR
jgi:hypothetical protein